MRYRKNCLMVFCFLCCFVIQVPTQSNVYCQEGFIPPTPIDGFEALQNSMEYPQLCWKAGLETAFQLDINIDSLGTVKSVDLKPLFNSKISKSDSINVLVAISKIKSLKWKPALIDGKKINFSLSIPFIFYLYSNKKQCYDAYKRGRNWPKEYKVLPVIVSHEVGFVNR